MLHIYSKYPLIFLRIQPERVEYLGLNPRRVAALVVLDRIRQRLLRTAAAALPRSGPDGLVAAARGRGTTVAAAATPGLHHIQRLLARAERAVLQRLGRLVLALAAVQRPQVLEGGGDGGAVHLRRLVPAAVLAVGRVVLPVLVLLAVLGDLPDGFVLVVDAAEFLLVGSRQHLLIQGLRLFILTLRDRDMLSMSTEIQYFATFKLTKRNAYI